MGKTVHNDVLDAMLDKVATGNQMSVCALEPTTRTEAITTNKLAITAMTPGDGNDYIVGEGDTNGRKVEVQEITGVTVDTTGDADHVALVDGSILLYVTTCTTQGLTSGNTVDFPAWDIEVADPV